MPVSVSNHWTHVTFVSEIDEFPSFCKRVLSLGCIPAKQSHRSFPAFNLDLCFVFNVDADGCASQETGCEAG